jgi:hypothetical protein
MQTLNSIENQIATNENSIQIMDWEKLLRLYVQQWELDHPQFAGKEGFDRMMNSPGAMIEDSFNNLLQLRWFKDMKIIKGYIKKKTILSFEQYTGISTEEWERYEPGFATKYNKLVDKFYQKDLTYDKLQELINEGSRLKDSNDWYHGYI